MKALGLGPGDEILVPAYHCGAEVEALAAAGLTCRFFEATATLEPDEAELERSLGESVRALLLIHYFGFPQDGARWWSWCRARGLLLIEDCAHAALATRNGRPVGADGDLAIFSFRKTLPLPEGGAAVGPRSLSAPGGPAAHPGALLKSHTRWAMTRAARLDRALAPRERQADGGFDLGDVRSASRATGFLLSRLATPDVAQRRRDAYSRILAASGGRAPGPFAELPMEACPLFFPLETRGDADTIAAGMREEGIDARPFWPRLHPLLDASSFPGAVAWHRRFLALPCHQDLDDADLDRIEKAVACV